MPNPSPELHAAIRALHGESDMNDEKLGSAIDAFVAASPTARAQHAALVHRLVDQASTAHLWSLTHLACAMQTSDVWKRVQTLIQEHSAIAHDVIIAAPWRALPKTVRAAILKNIDRHPAIGAARGRRFQRLEILRDSASAFFAALTPNVWNALSPDMQRQWRDALPDYATHLAV